MNEHEKELYIQQEWDKHEWVADFKADCGREIDSIYQRKWETMGGRDDQRDQAGR